MIIDCVMLGCVHSSAKHRKKIERTEFFGKKKFKKMIKKEAARIQNFKWRSC